VRGGEKPLRFSNAAKGKFVAEVNGKWCAALSFHFKFRWANTMIIFMELKPILSPNSANEGKSMPSSFVDKNTKFLDEKRFS
jgi:hypothetical protein